VEAEVKICQQVCVSDKHLYSDRRRFSLVIINFIHHKVEKDKYVHACNTHKYSINNKKKKKEKRRKLVTKHGLDDQL